MNILDRGFKYVPSVKSDIRRHWPTLAIQNERLRMQKSQDASKEARKVTPITSTRRKS